MSALILFAFQTGGEGTPTPVPPHRQVVVYADGQLQRLSTAAGSPGAVLAEAGVSLAEGDLISRNGLPLAPDDDLPASGDLVLQVQRAVRIAFDGMELVTTAETVAEVLWETGRALRTSDEVSPLPEAAPDMHTAIGLQAAQPVLIQVDGETLVTRTAADTVGEALADGGLGLQGLDYSLPADDAPVPGDGEIEVVRVEEEVILEQVTIPFDTLTQPAPDLEIDTQQVVQVGAFGLQVSRVRVRYENGVEVSRITEAEWQAAAPQPRILGYGTHIVVRTIDTPDGPIEYWRSVQVFATSYSPCRLGVDECGNTTASGLPLEKGMVGVIRSWYNAMVFSQVYVPGYGVGTIADIGGGVSGSHWIDLGYSDEDWVSWAKTLTVYFLTPVPPPEQILWILP